METVKHDHSGPIRGQNLGHVINLDQSQPISGIFPPFPSLCLQTLAGVSRQGLTRGGLLTIVGGAQYHSPAVTRHGSCIASGVNT